MNKFFTCIAICIIFFFMAGCSQGNKSDLTGNTFCADDGGTISFTSADSCVVKKINWHNVFGDLADKQEYKDEYKSTWKYVDSSTIEIDTGEFTFHVDRPNVIDDISSTDGSPYIFIYIGDPDEQVTYQFYKQ